MIIRILILFALAIAATPQNRTITDAEVMKVHRSALLIDTHNDLPTERAGIDREGGAVDIGPRSPTAHTDLVRLREGGVGAVFFAAYVGAKFVEGNHSANQALQ